MTALDLRVSRPDDPDALPMIAEVQRWYVQVYGDEDHDPLIVDEFQPPDGCFLLGCAAGSPVAMGGWSFLDDDRTSAKLRRMYVRPEARRHGFAAALLDALEADALAAGASWTVLTTGEPQAAAVRFYRARGYTDIAPFGFYAAEATAVHLGKALSAGASLTTAARPPAPPEEASCLPA